MGSVSEATGGLILFCGLAPFAQRVGESCTLLQIVVIIQCRRCRTCPGQDSSLSPSHLPLIDVWLAASFVF